MSKPTDFRLQSVLNFKTGIVDSLEVEFGKLKGIHRQELNILQQLEHTALAQQTLLEKEQLQTDLDCDTITLHQKYLQMLHHRIIRQKVRVKAARANMETKRAELIKTMREQKTLENLKDKHQTRVARELLQKEARIIDDLVITRYARKGYSHA